MNSAHSAGDGAGIRVVIQNGEYWLRNNGDLAMLDTTVARIRERWPRATISVLTSAPSLLRAYVPGTRPLSDGRLTRLSPPLWRAAELAGPAAVGPLSGGWLQMRQDLSRRLAERRARHAGPVPADTEDVNAASPRGGELPVLPEVRSEVGRASLVLAIGGGYLCDVDPAQTERTLGLMEAAVAAGVPAALVGQGLGPLTDPGLLAHAARVLPHVDLIALREGRRGPDLLDRLGVDAGRVVVTGDDAIELAASVRSARIGTGIGICLRVAEYSPVAGRVMDEVRGALHATSDEFSAHLVPLIISEYRSEDRRSTLPLVAGAARAVPPLQPYVGARVVAQRVARCRVVVTGAYHLAVFALAQGIPVVALTSSEYYDDKFHGLSGMFGGGVELVHLDAADAGRAVAAAIRTAWEQAPVLQAQLRVRADVQILQSRAALDRVMDLVDVPRPQPVAASV